MSHAAVQMPRFDPKRTEQFLLTQSGVLDASVWMRTDELNAHVTVDAFAEVDSRDLQRACLETLGIHQTPRRILLLKAHPLAA